MIAKTAHPLRAIAPPTLLSEPVIHPRHEDIDRDVMTYLVNSWDWPSERVKQGFISWKLSDVVLYMFPTGEYTRVKLACELLLLAFLMDDWFECHSLEENNAVMSRLYALFDSPSTFSATNTIERMHQSVFSRIQSVNSNGGGETAVLETYVQNLACNCDPARGTFTTLREYLVFREVDVGMPICMALLYWTEEITLTQAEEDLLAPLQHVANYHVSIMNDIFSFDREWVAAQKLGEGAVLVNGVKILADEAMVSVATAKCLSFALVRAWEAEFKRIAGEMIAAGEMKDEKRMLRVVAGIERRMTGAEAFSWRSKRYA